MTRRRVAWLGASMVLVATSPRQATAQAVVGGVIDAATRAPVSGAVVELVGSGESVAKVSTSSDGRYALRAETPGRYGLRVAAPGYRLTVMGPLELKRDVQIEQVIELSPLAPAGLDTVVVKGEKIAVPWYLTGFYGRREHAQGLGSFLTPEDIERLSPHNPSDLIRRLYGFTLGREQAILNLRNPSGCPPLIFIDGLPAPAVQDAADLNARLWVDVLAAVEGYHSPARVPVEFNVPGAACGVLVFWTKR